MEWLLFYILIYFIGCNNTKNDIIYLEDEYFYEI